MMHTKNVLSCAMIAQIFADCAQNFKKEVLLLQKYFVNCAQKSVLHVRQNVKNLRTSTVAKNAQPHAENAPLLVHQCKK
jgi:hypothetical protein